MTEQELSVEVVDDEPAWKGNVRAIGALYMMLVAAVVVFFALSTWRWSDWFEGFRLGQPCGVGSADFGDCAGEAAGSTCRVAGRRRRPAPRGVGAAVRVILPLP